MEINKVTFDNSNLGISQSFSDLDVNNDGVINEKDAKAAKSTDIKNIINNLLENVDDEAEIVNVAKTGSSKSAEKTSASKNSYGLLQTDSSSFEEDVTNSKGTVYVIMGNLSGCGYCTRLANEMASRIDELNSVATCYNIEWNSNSSLCRSIYQQGGGGSSATFPQIAKFVDGKFVELLDNPRNASSAVQSMIDKAEKSSATDDTETTESTDDTTAGTATTTGTGAATSTVSAETTAKISELTAKLDSINAELETLTAQLTTLQEEKTALEAEKAEAEAAVEAATEELEQEQKQLEIYTREYDNYQESIEQVNEEILKEQNREEEEFKESMSDLVNKTIDNYDPNEDGDDFNAYFLKQMDGASFPTFTKLDDLNSKAQNLSSEAQTLLKNIINQSQVVAAAKSKLSIANTNLADVTSRLEAKNTEISGVEKQISAKETEKASVTKELDGLKTSSSDDKTGLTGTELLAKISDAEKKLLTDNNISLKDCIVAQGEDGQFHIYKRSGNAENDYYISLARWYGKDSGYDIVPNGSGFLLDLKDAAEGQGRPVYTFTCVNDDLTEGTVTEKAGCYSTCSPLSFDVDGDGVNTTEETVSFDIDGDGQLDTVNNSAEWVLAFDKDKDGIAGEDGSELFGDNTDLDGDGIADGFKDGFAALKALAEKENLIGDGDTKLDADDIKVLSDKYGLTMTNGYGGEAKSLSDLGISEINLADTDETTLTKNFDGRNNDIMTQEGATFVVNGETRDYADIWNAKKDASEAVSASDKAEESAKSIKAKKVDDTIADLHLNKDGIVALKGDVDYSRIKNKAIDSTYIPQSILDEMVEIKEEQELEKEQEE